MNRKDRIFLIVVHDQTCVDESACTKLQEDMASLGPILAQLTKNEVQMGQLDASLYSKLASDLGITGKFDRLADDVSETLFQNFQLLFH